MDAAGGAGNRHLPALLGQEAAAVVYLRSPHGQRRCSVRPMPLVQRAQRSHVAVLVVSASKYGKYGLQCTRAHTYKKCSTHGRLPDACPDRPFGDASRQSQMGTERCEPRELHV
jgi:hypothetical protein